VTGLLSVILMMLPVQAAGSPDELGLHRPEIGKMAQAGMPLRDMEQNVSVKNEKPSLDTAMIDSLEIKDMEMTDVLKLFSQKSGLNIIAGKNIGGKVSIYLNNVSLKEALSITLDSNSLAYQEEGALILVMTAEEYKKRYGRVFGGKFHTRVSRLIYARAKDVLPVLEEIRSPEGKIVASEKSNTIILIDTDEKLDMMTGLLAEVDVPVEAEVFELNYAKVKDFAEKAEPLLTQGVGSIKYDERSNKIVIVETEEKMREIYKMIKAFDTKERQVLIEAKIVQIELTDSFELGVNWEAVFAGVNDLGAKVDFDVIDATAANKGSLTVGTIAKDNYNVMIEALKQLGDTNVLSSPSITALSNKEAKILVGSTQPYVTTTTTSTSGVATTAETINFIDVGVKLYVTPTIHKDNFITMNIRPEVSSVLGSLETSGGNNVPIVKTSEAETTVRIKDGVTVVIGGLIEDSAVETSKKVPLLGDIPLLGAAFRNQSTSKVKTEIAIFLTPKIITGEEGIGSETRGLADRSVIPGTQYLIISN